MAGVLDGIRVLDLTRNIAGPFCTMILGDLGAEVMKLERPGTGDDGREWRPPAWNGRSTAFLGFNRNKRSLAVDLDHPGGQAIVRRLAANADVMVESFRHGSLAKRGLDYEQIRAENPRIVFCSITGFGTRGPQRNRPGYDPVVQAYSGIMSLTGEPGRPPVRTGPSIVDMGAGMWAALGIVGALFARMRTNEGCKVDTSLFEAGVAWVGYQLVGYLATGKVPPPMGSRVPMIAPYEGFATRDGHLQLCAGNDNLFARLCHALEVPDLPADPRFRTNADRVAHRGVLHEILEVRFRTRSAREWEETLLTHEIPCSCVRTLNEVAQDPQVEALEMLPRVPHPAIPNLRLANLPLMIGGRRATRLDPPPEVGQHTDEILGSLGYTTEQIRSLRELNVIG